MAAANAWKVSTMSRAHYQLKTNWFVGPLVGDEQSANQSVALRRPYNAGPRRRSRNYSVDQSKIITLIANDIILSAMGVRRASVRGVRPALFSACN